MLHIYSLPQNLNLSCSILPIVKRSNSSCCVIVSVSIMSAAGSRSPNDTAQIHEGYAFGVCGRRIGRFVLFSVDALEIVPSISARSLRALVKGSFGLQAPILSGCARDSLSVQRTTALNSTYFCHSLPAWPCLGINAPRYGPCGNLLARKAEATPSSLRVSTGLRRGYAGFRRLFGKHC